MIRSVTFRLFAVALLASGTLFAQSAEVAIKRDIAYKQVNGNILTLDVGLPQGTGPFPAVVFFHGGGWQQGDKAHMHKWIRKVVASGYAGISVAYSFAPRYRWPTQVEDAMDAIRWIHTNANQYKINPHRIAVMGESAGGYLALMVGLVDEDDSLAHDIIQSKPTRNVQAVVSYFSATDFTAPRQELSPSLKQEMLKYYGKSLEQVRSDFTGTTDPHDPILRKISVLSYADTNDPPVLIFHGDQDPFVSLDHALKLTDQLKQANVPHQLVIVKGGAHGWSGESEKNTTQRMMEFLSEQLNK